MNFEHLKIGDQIGVEGIRSAEIGTVTAILKTQIRVNLTDGVARFSRKIGSEIGRNRGRCLYPVEHTLAFQNELQNRKRIADKANKLRSAAYTNLPESVMDKMLEALDD
jgi:hypothetical protein